MSPIHDLFGSKFKISWFTDEGTGYVTTLEKWCSGPSILMSSQNLNDAKKECSESPNCHMFYDLEGAGDWFVACEVTSSIHDTTSSSYGTILYTKQHGNITHNLMFKDKL